MRKYEAPEIKVVNYSIKKNIMDDGYDPGDITDNPWKDFFTDPASGVDDGMLD